MSMTNEARTGDKTMHGEKTRKFYVGVKPCGCVGALLVDDEHTTADEIADFAKHMSKTSRRMEHRTVVTEDETRAVFDLCPHIKEPQA